MHLVTFPIPTGYRFGSLFGIKGSICRYENLHRTPFVNCMIGCPLPAVYAYVGRMMNTCIES